MNCRVSYLLLCYQQEQFVREAVRSALAQDMEDLEVIISDDCSTDETYEIILEECSKYSGTNSLVVRRTGSNLGINRHLNELVSMACGQLIVVAGGDDIARSDKASCIYREWFDGQSLVFGCTPHVIDEQGTIVGSFYSSNVPTDFSCDAIISRRNAGIFISAFDRTVFDTFGPLVDDAIEDQIIPFRASLLRDDGVAVIEEPLVQYRAHSDSQVDKLIFSSKRNSNDVVREKIMSHEKLYRCWLDEKLKADRFVHSSSTRVERSLNRELKFFILANELLACERLTGRLKLFLGNVEAGIFPLTRWLLILAFAISPSAVSYLADMYARNIAYSKRNVRGI